MRRYLAVFMADTIASRNCCGYTYGHHRLSLLGNGRGAAPQKTFSARHFRFEVGSTPSTSLRKNVVKPLIRWAGSKRQLVPRLSTYWGSQYDRYVEPFVGSACLFFNLEPASALLGDINADLIQTYRVVQKQPCELSKALRRWRNDRDEYYGIRALQPENLSEVERAARFIYLNRYCFNGLYRTNRRGQFNVPYGGLKSGSLPSLNELQAASQLLSRAQFVSSDFADVLSRVRAGDFVYLDPPFSVAGKRVFKEYDPSTFSDSDLIRLRRALLDMDEAGVAFLLSYAECPEGEELSDGFHTVRVSTRRNIAGFAASRRAAREILVTNILATERQQ
ncbi:MAG: DNA adenine methylase [Rhodothermia bacterium]|nr:MAG: DNA adenine methylase [Rhodothermia bacterium]